MMADIVVPKIGLTVETVEVLEWLKEVGDELKAAEPVVLLAADKTDLEVEAPESGPLTEILFPAGATVSPGAVLGRIGPTEPDAASDRSAGGSMAETPSAPWPEAATIASVVETSQANADGARVRISPLARRTAKELQVEPRMVKGTGPRGRIVRRDIESAAANGHHPATAAPGVGLEPSTTRVPDPSAAGFEEVRFTAARRITARLMSLSQHTVPPVTLHCRAPAEIAQDSVRRLKAEGLPATFTHAVLAACARTLPEHPSVNAVWDGERLLRSDHVHLGIAVDDDGDLLTGVLADAHSLDTTGIVLGAVAAVLHARRRLGPTVPATFTVSNLGMFGVEQFTPIVTPPQIAVLGVGAIVDGRCHLSLTFDHRAVDGAPVARFLADVRRRIAAFDGC